MEKHSKHARTWLTWMVILVGGLAAVQMSLAWAAPGIQILNTALPSGVSGFGYNVTLYASGGVEPYVWAPLAGSVLPTGFQLSAGGVLAGTPASTGSYSVAVQVTDATGKEGTQSYTLTISKSGITTTSVPEGVQGIAYNTTLSATGGTPPYSWSAASGQLPAGLSLSSSGAFSGTPSVPGYSSFTVKATDKKGHRFSQTLGVATVAPLTVPSSALPSGTVGHSYKASLGAAGGKTPYTWTLVSGAPPAVLGLDTTGTIAGTPTQTGAFGFTVQVSDAFGQQAIASPTIVITSPVSITTNSLPNGNVGTAYNAPVTATGGTSPYTWTVSSGALPAGLALSSGGVISGTPTAAGTSTFTLTVTDSSGGTSSLTYAVSVAGAFAITTTSLPNGAQGVAYTATLAATGGTAPYTWSILSGLLPVGVGLSTATGTVSGTPTTSGSYNVTVQALDSAGQMASKALSFVIAAGLSITTSSIPNATAGFSYDATLAASGGTPPLTWAVSSGQLPTGLSLSSSGSITGTPSSTGAYTFTAQVTDSSSPQASASQQLTLTIGGTDSYGGRSDLNCAGGAQPRFYSERIGSRMWLCTPAGNAIWAQGMYVAGPQGNFAAKYGSSSNAYEQTLARLKNWGFNFLHTYSDANLMPWNRATKMPAVWIVRPGGYGMYASSRPDNPFPAGTLDQNIKDLGNGASPYFTNISQNGIVDWSDLARLNKGLTYLLTRTQGIDPLGLAAAIQRNNSLDYLIGVAVEDSDQTWGYWGSGEHDPFESQPSGRGTAHGGYMTAIMSPQQQADGSRQSLYTTDQTVYTKKAWHDFLVAKYGTISALNAAWGSNYTTFDSSATTVTGESLGTTDGTAFTFSKTLANSGTLVPNSLRVYQDGAMIAGDCFHPAWGDNCNPTTGTNWGAVWGPTASGGTVNYGTKTVTLAFTGVYKYLLSLSCTTGGAPSCTATINDYDDAGFGATVGRTISVRSSTCCSTNNESVISKSGDVGGVYTYTWTNTAGNSGSESWAGGARDLVATVTSPTAGHTLTINYQLNGWDAGGTGLMDEDGRPAHSWLGSDPYALANANATVAADLRAFLNQLASKYFSSMRTGVRVAFTNAGLAAPMYLGPDAFGTWTSTPRKEVLQAASGTIDLAIMGGAAGYTLTQSMLDFMAQWYGGPFLDGVFLHANADSPFSTNVLEFDYSTQAARGSAFQLTVQSYLSSTTSSGFNPRVGFGWWQYGDNSGEGTNWGLVTLKDNAYNGHEAVSGSVPCSAPLQGYSCGGEARSYGDVITSVTAANSLWKTQ
jgi:hypothetical protein